MEKSIINCFSKVVKVHCEGASPSYLLPWQVDVQESWTGTGFEIEMEGETRILTNAHVVEHAFVVRVSRHQNVTKKHAKVLCIASDLDLALLEVTNKGRVGDTALVLTNELPSLFSPLVALGYPEGGNTICVTKGVVSRIDAHIYAHARSNGFSSLTAATPGKLLILQVDAAINAGNSGGPALNEKGEVVGVASSGVDNAQNVGYIIPTPLVRLFLDEYTSKRSWQGVSEPGFSYRTLEAEALKEYLGLVNGVLVTSIAPLGAAHAHLSPKDVLLAIDDLEISTEGTVECATFENGDTVQLPLEHLITKKAKGINTKVLIQRNNEKKELFICFRPLPPLLPRYCGQDAYPSYAIFGGLVFTRLTMPLYQELIEAEAEEAPLRMMQLLAVSQKWKEKHCQEIVVLLRVLRHNVNEGIECSDELRIITKVNDKEIESLEDLVCTSLNALQNSSSYIRFGFKNNQKKEATRNVCEEEVLKASQIFDADSEILPMHGIPAPVSKDLLCVYTQHAPASNTHVSSWISCLTAISKRFNKKRQRDIDD